MTAAAIVLYLSVLSPLIPVWTGRKIKNEIWYYALACFIFDVNALILKALHVERLWASNLFFLVEFILVSCYFHQYVFDKKFRKQVLIVLGLVAAYFVVDTCWHSVLKPNYVGAGLFYCFYILFAVVGLYKVMKETEYLMIERSPLFIFCVAFLIYASGSLIIFLFEHEILKNDKEFTYIMWLFVRNPMNILKNILIGYGLALPVKKKQRAM